jgi:hypothetical protein
MGMLAEKMGLPAETSSGPIGKSMASKRAIIARAM